jgi:hypothetical protein
VHSYPGFSTHQFRVLHSRTLSTCKYLRMALQWQHNMIHDREIVGLGIKKLVAVMNILAETISRFECRSSSSLKLDTRTGGMIHVSCSHLVKVHISLFGDLMAAPLHFAKVTPAAGGITCFCIDRRLKGLFRQFVIVNNAIRCEVWNRVAAG